MTKPHKPRPTKSDSLDAQRIAALELLATGLVFKFTDLGPMLGLGQTTIDDLALQGRGPTIFRIGRQRYVHRIALHRWLRKLSDESDVEPGAPFATADDAREIERR